MGFRFYRRVKLCPGVSLNLGKRGASVSVGPRGAKMTFGPNGTRSCVGIPGTGIRYEKRYSSGRSSGGGGGSLSPWMIISIMLAIGAFIAFKLSEIDKHSPAPIIAMLLLAVGAFVFFIIGAICSSSSDTVSTSTYSRTKKNNTTSSLSKYDAYINELANATKSFYAFLKELNRSTRCRNILKGFPSLDAFDNGTNNFTINPRLAAVVYCDVRDCFRELGYDPGNLSGLCGIGYAMLVILLINRDFDLSLFHNRETVGKWLKIVSDLQRTSTVKVDIEGHDEEFRFSVLFGVAHSEHEWVQRYATVMYRWASLVAKVDGQISSDEAATLAAIMKMRESKPDGNVKISGASEVNKVSGDQYAQTVSHTSEKKSMKPTTLREALASLDNLIGLDPVKKEVKMLANFIQIQRKRKSSGLKEAPISYHCVFTGNPGTGKTMVARILADIYRAMGVVKKGHLVETDRSGLVGEYVGQTAVKTNKIIDSALDGVLFIDEAYTLVQGGERDYGGEAIATLLKRMEDDRDRLVVILAGYTDDVKKFIDSNPGLQSRFNRYIQFSDYSAQELSKIFLLTAEKSQYSCNADVRASLVAIMQRAVETKDRNFGNGRYVRNLFEKAIQRQAERLSTVGNLTTEMLSELTLHDLGFAYE